MTTQSMADFVISFPAFADLKPRVRSKVASRVSGLSQRHITELATKGLIPGALKHGGIWTFDQELFVLWLKKGNQCQKTSTSRKAAKITTFASKSTAKNTESRFAQLLKGSRKASAKADRRAEKQSRTWRYRLDVPRWFCKFL